MRLFSIGAKVGLALFIVWAAWGFLRPLLHLLGKDWTQAGLGVWGDSFGALNALFTAFGFSAVVATLWMQQKQNDFNERDQHRQQFDRSFFELLELLRETRKDVEFRPSQEARDQHGVSRRDKVKGISAFRSAWEEILFWHERSSGDLSADEMGAMYHDNVHKRYESNFGPYFRLLYTIMRRIDEDEILSKNEKIQYGRLLRSQLNSYETALVGFNGLAKVSKNFRLYIVEFRLLKYLPDASRRRAILMKYYPNKAFEGREAVVASSFYLHGSGPTSVSPDV